MSLSKLRTLFFVAVGTVLLAQLKAQNVSFVVPSPVFVNCGDATEPADIIAISGTGPVDGVSTSIGTTDCTSGAPNMLTLTHTDILLPATACMDEAVLISRRWTATDACGTTDERVQTIISRDQVPPTITCRDLTLNATLGGVSTILPGDIVVSATDNCGGSSTQVTPALDVSQSAFSLCNGAVQVTASATDGCGNVATCSSMITMISDCPPSLGCNAEVNVSLAYNCVAEINPSLIIEDRNMLCPIQIRLFDANNILVKKTDATTSPFTFPQVDISFVGQTWKAEAFYTDCSGTEISCWGFINVEDKIRPPVTCIDDFEVSCKDDLSDLFTSTSMAEICVDGPDLDNNIATTTLALTVNSGSVQPWEIVTALNSSANLACVMPMTGSGTGSAVVPGFTVGGNFSAFTCESNGQYSFDVLTGASAASLTSGTSTVTIPAGTLPAAGLCFDISTQSFGSYNPDNCDPNAEVVIISDVLDENECGNSGFVALRRIAYRILDSNGASSSGCTVDVNFTAEPLSEIEFPADFTHSNDVGACLSVNDVGPNLTGRPTLNGDLLTDGNLCKLSVSFEDTRLDLINGVATGCPFDFAIRREWIVLDWCLGEFEQHFQTINVFDVAPPICATPGDITISTTSGCEASFLVTPFVAGSSTELFLDDCSGVNILAVEYTQIRESFSFDPIGGTVFQAQNLGNNTFNLQTLPIGQNWVRYILEDGCGNAMNTECFFEITVVDNNPPVAVCDQFTAVALADNGWGRLLPESIDDGSFSPCGGEVTLEVRRPSNPCPAEMMDRNDTVFGPFVQFCCAEAGQTVPVMLRVTDTGGQSSTCSVNVVIQDKNSDAAVVCPMPTNIVIDQCTMADPTIRFGTPRLSGDCTTPEIIDIANTSSPLNDCGMGSFTRTWTIAVNGNVDAVPNCTQRITVTGDDGLTQNSFTFPADLEITNCANGGSDLDLSPTIGGVDILDADLCARLAFSFSDNNFFNTEGYCVKTIRTYTVINWCVFDPVTNPDEGMFTDTQIIKIMNSDGPIISNCPDGSTIVLEATTVDCEVLADIPVPSAVDACFGDDLLPGDFSWTVTGPGSNTSGAGDSASQVLEVGTHTVVWSIDGSCQSTSTCQYEITVENNSGPLANCRSNVVGLIDGPGTNGMMPGVTVSASDFDMGSMNACGGPLSISFDANDPTATTIDFNCTQIGDHVVEVFFTDADGTQDSCTGTVTVDVDGNFCDMVGSLVDLGGNVFTEQLSMVEDVDITLINTLGETMDNALTDDGGHFAFSDISSDSDYRIEAESSEDNYLNGVSTLDLVMIQRHILGVESLDSPYRLIAADVNSTEDINGIDLIELRKLILGIYEELPQNDSWRFVDEAFEFAVPTNPWPFRENIDLQQPNHDMPDNDFVAIKVGDVDNSAIAQLVPEEVDNRNAVTVGLHNELLRLEANNYLVPVYFDKDLTFNGLQFSLKMKEGVEILDIEKGKLDLTDVDYLMTEDRMTLAYVAEKEEKLTSEEALFYMTVRIDGKMKDSPYVIDNQMINSELYDDELAVVDIVSGIGIGERPILFQNSPNPWSTQTLIEFQLPKSGEVVLTLMSSDGRILKTEEGWFEKGNHKVVWNANDMQEHGVYYYQMETENHSIIKKMIRID